MHPAPARKRTLAGNVLREGILTCSPIVADEQKVAKIMLSRCANTECSKPFLRLRDGKLFLVETNRVARPGETAAPPFVRARQAQRQVEHWWLCDECATQWTLIFDRENGVVLSPLRRPIAAAATTNAPQAGVA
jgi:hypothetical protein